MWKVFKSLTLELILLLSRFIRLIEVYFVVLSQFVKWIIGDLFCEFLSVCHMCKIIFDKFWYDITGVQIS